MVLRDVDYPTSSLFNFCVVTTFALFVATTSAANDWPEWRGEGRDGVWTESGIINELPASVKASSESP